MKIKVSCPCRTCGFYDYFDDFRIFLEEEGVKSKIVSLREEGNEAEVKFLILRGKE